MIEKILKIQKGEEKPTFSFRGRPVVRKKIEEKDKDYIKKEKIKRVVEEFIVKILSIVEE